MKFEELTPRQSEVVGSTEPVVLVLGGPGSGKTTTALWAAKRAVDGMIEKDQRVLFLTFSKTAVSQIARSAPEILGASQGRIEIFTFHALAWRLVRAFGRYGGHGAEPPELQSEARVRLLGRDAGRMVYGELLPAGRALLRSKRIMALVRRRWPLVICDEFQDTGDEQWKLVEELSSGGRSILLCDPNQMIYSGFLGDQGVGPKRLEIARAAASRVIELETRSHRDPSGAIPAMAEAIRLRHFEDAAVAHAVETGRLIVVCDVDDGSLESVVVEQIGRARARGAKSVGVFGRSNLGVAELAAGLSDAKVDHVLVGISEAHAEALNTIATLCAYGVGMKEDDDVRLAFATFLTACVRGNKVPEMATSLKAGADLPALVRTRLDELEGALRDAASATVGELVRVACRGWEAIGIIGGKRPWRRAALDFVALARRFALRPASEATIQPILAVVERRHANPLLESDPSVHGPVQLMNFHQTKGREADAVLLVYRGGDYLANKNAAEPFEESSRVLMVALTRAKQEVTVILPPDPHPLVAPFAGLGVMRR